MKKVLFFAMMAIAFMACNPKESGVVDPSKPSESKELTPEQSKEKLAGVAQKFMAKFNTEDQKAAVELAESIQEDFESYRWDSVEAFLYEAIYESYGKLPRYMVEVAKGHRAPAEDAPQVLIFSLDRWGVLFEADEATKNWILKGKTEDGSTIFRFKDRTGKTCELKGWGEGKTKEINYVIPEASGVNTLKIFAPDAVHATMTQGGTQIFRIDINQEFKDNDFIKLDLKADLANVTFTTKEDISLNSAALAWSFFYNKEELMSMAVNIPGYKVDGKTQDETLEEWFMKNMENGEQILATIGKADLLFDVLHEVQLKVDFNNVAKFYSDYQAFENAQYPSAKEGYEALCQLMNSAQTNGLYYNSPVKQAEFRVQVGSHDYEYQPGEVVTEYTPEAVIYFPQDGTTYAIESYFGAEPFTSVVKSVEELMTSYMRLFHMLDDGEEFHF